MRCCSNCNKKILENEKCYYIEASEEYFCYEDKIKKDSCVHMNLVECDYSETQINEILSGKGDFEIFSTIVPD